MPEPAESLSFFGPPPPGDSSARTRSDLDAYLRGDTEAFGRIWTRFLPGLEVLVRGRVRSSLDPALRVRLDDEIEDLLQEVAGEASQCVRRFEYRGAGSLMGWLRDIVQKRLLDRIEYWRAGRRSPRMERRKFADSRGATSNHAPTTDDLRDVSPGPFTQLAKSEDRQRVANALATLTERDHTIVWMKFFAGADWNEIAASIGAPSSDAVRMEFNLKILPRLVALLRPSPAR